MNWQRLGGGLAISLIVGLLAGGFVFSQFKKMALAKSMPTIQVVVSSKPLPLGTRLQAGDLRLVTWPAAQPVLGMFTRIDDCVNRAVITSMVENEPLLEGKLAPKDGGAGLSATIPDGMRAVSVSVNDVIGVAGFVVPGTMVDVLVTGGTNFGNITRTILENVRVMAAGQKVEQDREGKPQTVPVITLLVSPQDANSLTMASTQGRIQLALRNTLDSKKVDPPPVLQAFLFGGMPTPPPQVMKTAHVAAAPKPLPPPPPEAFNVEVIRGDKKEETKFQANPSK
ncbi:MAG TPA: Flp pilus assembly protein CpaB [Candidatus Acidoferrales bacterium]|jgi:pilus assembly protein CpaB|nr:Flp pilus assembly protein CpaB [Candidatus Acidoferrales bacterium]